MVKTRCANHIDYVEFPVPSSSALMSSKTFFTDVFGWSYKSWGDDYADTAESGVGSGLNADPANRPSKPLVVVYTNDLVAMRAKVIAAGGTITRDTFSFPGGSRFHFREPGGNELAVWSEG